MAAYGPDETAVILVVTTWNIISPGETRQNPTAPTPTPTSFLIDILQMNPYRRSVHPHIQVRRRHRQGGRWQNYSSDARCLATVEDFDSILLREVIRGSDSTRHPCVMDHLYVSRPYNYSQALPHGRRKVKTMRMVESTSLPFNVTAFSVSPPSVLYL